MQFAYLIVVFSLTTYVRSLRFEDFEDINLKRFPKCCDKAEYLISENDKFKCKKFGYQHFEIVSSDFANFPENCSSVQCVDFLITPNETKLVKIIECDTVIKLKEYIGIPKCCPFDSTYDPEEHKCVQNEKSTLTIPEGLNVFKLGLSSCEFSNFAIVDYVDEKFILNERKVVLQNGKNINYGKYCLDTNYYTGKNILRTCEPYEDVCTTIRCFRKCCPDGEMYKNSTKCLATYSNGINITSKSNRIQNSNDKKFGIIQVPPGKKYVAKQSHKFYINKFGDFEVNTRGFRNIYNSKKAFYCIETVQKNDEEPKLNFFIFFSKNSSQDLMRFKVLSIMLIISCVCLMLTIFCYMILPELQNLYGKLIMIYCSIMLAGFAILASVQLYSQYMFSSLCVTFGFLIIFTWLGSFTWLNVICFDMWLAFGTMKVINVNKRSKQWKRFFYYNLYGWGVPSFITLTAFAVYKTRILPDKFVPHIGINKCFFDKRQNSYDYFIYFIFPMMILIISNCVLFIKIVRYCLKVDSEIERMDDGSRDKNKRRNSFNADKEKLSMMLKLFLIMGISWLFEIISSLWSFNKYNSTEIIEMIWDGFNALQGLFIFCIFILKKKVFHILGKKLCPTFFRRRLKDLNRSDTMTTTYTISNKRISRNCDAANA